MEAKKFNFYRFSKNVGSGVVALAGVAAIGATSGGSIMYGVNFVATRQAERAAKETAVKESTVDQTEKPQTYATFQTASLSRSRAVNTLAPNSTNAPTQSQQRRSTSSALPAPSIDDAEKLTPKLRSYRPSPTNESRIKQIPIARYEIFDADASTSEEQMEFGERIVKQERERAAQYKHN